MLKFYPETQTAYDKMFALGVVDDTVETIIELIMEQEVISYSTEKGTITFDPSDVDWEA